MNIDISQVAALYLVSHCYLWRDAFISDGYGESFEISFSEAMELSMCSRTAQKEWVMMKPLHKLGLSHFLVANYLLAVICIPLGHLPSHLGNRRRSASDLIHYPGSRLQQDQAKAVDC